eukprot:maker-scaffold68_size422247-snap-gene-0.10 protein:Tk11380 transcript:maker-scaffold68_size422247-snap-gene-0.10-mRNA-1 annotation:"upf0545 protein c22orf39 homolog"
MTDTSSEEGGPNKTLSAIYSPDQPEMLTAQHPGPIPDLPHSWLLRHCTSYKMEHQHCAKWSTRLHQRFILGEPSSCEDWQSNFMDCARWDQNQDLEAAARVIEREKSRIGGRMKDHFANDVWEKRTHPPEDWNKPLPPHLAEMAEGSWLQHCDRGTLNESAVESANSLANRISASLFCSIM